MSTMHKHRFSPDQLDGNKRKKSKSIILSKQPLDKLQETMELHPDDCTGDDAALIRMQRILSSDPGALERNVSLSPLCDKQKLSRGVVPPPLVKACLLAAGMEEVGAHEGCVRWLVDSGADVKRVLGNFLVMKRVFRKPSILQILLAQQPDLNVKISASSTSPTLILPPEILYLAIENPELIPSLKLLLEAGVLPEPQMITSGVYRSLSPLQGVIYNVLNRNLDTPLNHALSCGNLEAYKLLLQYGAVSRPIFLTEPEDELGLERITTPIFFLIHRFYISYDDLDGFKDVGKMRKFLYLYQKFGGNLSEKTIVYNNYDRIFYPGIVLCQFSKEKSGNFVVDDTGLEGLERIGASKSVVQGIQELMQPRSLQEACRLVIRGAVGSHQFRRKVDELGVPGGIMKFLKFDDVEI